MNPLMMMALALAHERQAPRLATKMASGRTLGRPGSYRAGTENLRALSAKLVANPTVTKSIHRTPSGPPADVRINQGL